MDIALENTCGRLKFHTVKTPRVLIIILCNQLVIPTQQELILEE